MSSIEASIESSNLAKNRRLSNESIQYLNQNFDLPNIPKSAVLFNLSRSWNSCFLVTTGLFFQQGPYRKKYTCGGRVVSEICLPGPCFRILIYWKIWILPLTLNLPEIQTLFLYKYRLNFFRRCLNRKFLIRIISLHWKTFFPVFVGIPMVRKIQKFLTLTNFDLRNHFSPWPWSKYLPSSIKISFNNFLVLKFIGNQNWWSSFFGVWIPTNCQNLLLVLFFVHCSNSRISSFVDIISCCRIPFLCWWTNRLSKDVFVTSIGIMIVPEGQVVSIFCKCVFFKILFLQNYKLEHFLEGRNQFFSTFEVVMLEKFSNSFLHWNADELEVPELVVIWAQFDSDYQVSPNQLAWFFPSWSQSKAFCLCCVVAFEIVFFSFRGMLRNQNCQKLLLILTCHVIQSHILSALLASFFHQDINRYFFHLRRTIRF